VKVEVVVNVNVESEVTVGGNGQWQSKWVKWWSKWVWNMKWP
jgi:hypothetical protein